MQALADVAPAFVSMAHRIVWCSVASVDDQGRPRSRILHPIWQWDGAQLVGWIATSPTPAKQGHLAASPFMSLSYWDATHDTCVAECRAALLRDDSTRTMVWDLFKHAPPPVGYDPAMIPSWQGPLAESFAALQLDPWRLRVFPGSVLLGQGGAVLTWRA